jgi:threonine dehydratase
MELGMIDLETIRNAAAAIGPYIHHTPLRSSFYFSEVSGFDISLKLENWQPTGSFKVRGALNVVRSLSIQERLHGLVAWSAGNHALGVAYASRIFDAPATIYVPRKTPRAKLDKLHHFLVDVRGAETYEDCEREGRALAEKLGLTIVHPYDDWRTVAGQGTVGIELHQQMPELDAVIVPVGGGGLISGISIAMKTLDPDIKVIGVQSANSPSLQKSLDDGVCYEEFPYEFSIAEGIAGGIGKIVYELAPKYVDEIVNVDEEEIKKAILLLLEHEQVVAEASAAVTLAALPQIESVPRGSRVAAIISGGNLNMKILREILQ